MRIRAGYELVYECLKSNADDPSPQHPSVPEIDLLTDQSLRFTPHVSHRDFIDPSGNVCTRIIAPAGRTTISTEFEIYDNGHPDILAEGAVQHAVDDLPDDVLPFRLLNQPLLRD